eukprot:s305_g2.t1
MVTLDALVSLRQDVFPYMLDWPGVDFKGVSEGAILVADVRPGGFLGVVPVGFIPEEVLAVGNSANPPGPVGPSTVLVVPGAVLDNGTLSSTGQDLAVLVVDFADTVLDKVRIPSETEVVVYSYDADQQFSVPHPSTLLDKVQEWVMGGGESSGLNFYTADNADGDPLEEEEAEDGLEANGLHPRPRRRKATAPGPGQPTTPGKRPTVASLAGSLEKLLSVNVGMQKQLEALSNRQQLLEQKSLNPGSLVPVHQASLRQPISSALTVPLVSSQAVAQAVGTPPRTVAPASPGLLRSSWLKPPEVGELEEEKPLGDPSTCKDPLAQAVLAQSTALTALVQQLASQSSDPLLDLSMTGSSSSTRGAQGRAKLQMELASQKGLFFQSVMASMSRRMFPTLPVEGSPQEMMAKGICGTKCLERFGGFGRHRELGCLQHQVMTVLDFLQMENLAGARDAAALLAVTLDQAALDNGRFDLASLLCLQEEPPSTVFSHKPATILSKARAFSPLADQRWVTVALAYVKELDLISSKRLELTSKPAAFGGDKAGEPSAKPKPFPKKKGRGGKGGGAQIASATFPLPLASLDCFRGSGNGLSRRKFWTLCKARLLNIWILVLDFMFLGRWPNAEELRRCPNQCQLEVFDRLRSFMVACGEAQVDFSLCPGRSSPELGAALYQLERFCDVCPELNSGYMEVPRVPFKTDPSLLSIEKHPELAPYRSLDSSRLRLVGQGTWPMESFMDGVLWLPFQEPRFLLHDLPLGADDVPCFDAEDPQECLALAKVWDARGLLFLETAPIRPGLYSRVFNAFKNPEADRQIGDRRAVNQAEYHVNGPSKHLPQGQQLTMLRLPRFTHMLRGSVTDRRDFYHQAAVSAERAASNMLPFSYPCEAFSNMAAWSVFLERLTEKHGMSREKKGDGFRDPVVKAAARRTRKSPALPERLYPCFQSLFQGDHLGVEFALMSHMTLLRGAGLLDETTRIQGHHCFPPGPKWDALVIDDYFALSAEPLCCDVGDTFAMTALARARRVYEDEKLLGSPEKDIVACPIVKAAGAEIRSCESNVRMGVVPVGAPFCRRLALAALSLRAARLPGVTSKLASRLAGNWVSLLQYRKCWSSLVDPLFAFAAQVEEGGQNDVLFLPRAVAQELVLVSSIAPLIFSNIAVDYLPQVFATDASLEKGAVVSAPIDPAECEEIWLGIDRKGSYSHLDNGFHAILRHLGEVDDDNEKPCPQILSPAPQKQPLMYFDFVEICGGAGKVAAAMSRRGWSVAPVLDLSESRHYDLSSLRLLEWVIYMLEENRFRSFLIAPPCTTFSPAAHPAVRSYREPLGFNRKDPKTLLGHVLALRSLCLMRVGRKCRRPCGLEQSRLSKMCWLSLWTVLMQLGFSEAIIASCMFGSPHRKEFRLLCYLLDSAFLEVRCGGGHSHVRVEGRLTKPSAVYVDGVADHFATAFDMALKSLDAEERLSPGVDGLESPVINEIALTSKWKIVRSWFWKRAGHINVLELASTVSLVSSLSTEHSSARFVSLVDSAVCRGALTKGRSPSRALQPGLKRLGAICVAADLYPCWGFCPTRLNTADDPTRSVEIREATQHAFRSTISKRLKTRLIAGGFRRFAANWIRLVLLAQSVFQGGAMSVSSVITANGFAWASNGFELSPWTLHTSAWNAAELSVCSFGGVCLFVLVCACCLGLLWTSCRVWSFDGGLSREFRPRTPICWKICAVAMAFSALDVAYGMPLCAQTAAERQRVVQRESTVLQTTRALRQQTRDRRKFYLERFQTWLLQERGVSLKFLLENKPPDPERIAGLLVEYGKEMFYAGKAYGIFAETINAVTVERPLIRRQMIQAWDLAFAWLVDEPYAHHPAMPLSVMLAMVTVALTWGWPHEAAVIMLAWTGIMRIGEVLAAFRADLILPSDAAPGTSFLLVMIKQPKTRARAAKHQAARVDQSDVIRFISAMYGGSPRDTKLWPFSAATLRKRFQSLLSALTLPTSRVGSAKPFDLGSLRPGGATWLLQQVEDSEIIRRRGRWLTTRAMEVYLQESFVATYLRTLEARTRTRIEEWTCRQYQAILDALKGKGYLDRLCPDESGVLNVGVPFCGHFHEYITLGNFLVKHRLEMPGVEGFSIFGMELFDDYVRDWALAQRWLWRQQISCCIEAGDLAQDPTPRAQWVIGIHPEVTKGGPWFRIIGSLLHSCSGLCTFATFYEEEKQTLLNMIDMYKVEGASVESFENPFYAANELGCHPAMRFIVVVDQSCRCGKDRRKMVEDGGKRVNIYMGKGEFCSFTLIN